MSEDNKELNKTENNDASFEAGKTYTREEMEKMFPGFGKQLEEAKNKSGGSGLEDGMDIGGKHYTKRQIEYMIDHPKNPPRKWTKAEKKARNKKNKAAAASRKKNRKK